MYHFPSTWMQISLLRLLPLQAAAIAFFCQAVSPARADEPLMFHHPRGGALAGDRYRVLVSTDIGGTDPDDFQSLVHLLLYADVLDLEGLVSSPYGPGRKDDILQVIDCYEHDHSQLRKHSRKYPTPEALRALSKQGETERAPYAGVRRATEGSEWIVRCARRDDPRPLHVLVWGGIEDLAQALHDAPEILPRLRVYWIGGPNKKWSPDAYQYLVTHHPQLWIIEANATYRGWFVGGNQQDEWGNTEFVAKHVAGKGALGRFFADQLGGKIKMGDTPSVGWLLRGTPEMPGQPSWGGQFVRAWQRPYYLFNQLPTASDRMEIFGIMELVLPLEDRGTGQVEARLEVENQSLVGYQAEDDTMRFRFSPKAAKQYTLTVRSNSPQLDGRTGSITALLPAPEQTQTPARGLPNWWTDDPAAHFVEGEHHGAKSVSQWRIDFLRDFAARMQLVAR